MELSTKQLFPNFSDDLLQELELNAVYQKANAGEIIIRTGQYFKNTVLILSGQIKVYREDDDGGEFFMYYLRPGQACALSMICATKSEKSQIMAKVTEDAELMLVSLKLMDRWMFQHRSWYEFVIETYRSRFEEVLEVIDSIAFRAMDERLEFYLERQQKAIDNNEINVSHQEIASDLNTSREVISRLLKKMEQRGRLKLHRNQIELFK